MGCGSIGTPCVFLRSTGGEVVKLLCSESERSEVSLLTGRGFLTLSYRPVVVLVIEVGFVVDVVVVKAAFVVGSPFEQPTEQ